MHSYIKTTLANLGTASDTKQHSIPAPSGAGFVASPAVAAPGFVDVAIVFARPTSRQATHPTRGFAKLNLTGAAVQAGSAGRILARRPQVRYMCTRTGARRGATTAAREDGAARDVRAYNDGTVEVALCQLRTMTLAAVAASTAAAAAAVGSIACCVAVEQRRWILAFDAQREEFVALCKALHGAPGLGAATPDSVLLEEIKELRKATGMFHEVLARLAEAEKRSDGALLEEFRSLRKGLHEMQQQRSVPGSSDLALLEEFQAIRRDISAEMRVVMERWDDLDTRRGGAAPVAGQAPASASLPVPVDWCLQQSQEIPLVDIPNEDLDMISGRLDHFAVDTANHILYLACLGSHCVLVIDTFAGRVVGALTGDTEGELYDADDNRRFYHRAEDGKLQPRYTCRVPSVRTPQGVLYVAATQHLYVASASGNVHMYSTSASGARTLLLGVLEFDGEVDNLRYFDGHVLVAYGDGAIGRIFDQPGLERWDAHNGDSGDDSSSDGESSSDRPWDKRYKKEKRQEEKKRSLQRSKAMRAHFQEACLDMSKTFAVDEHPEGFEIEQTAHPHRERRIFVNVADKCQVQVLGYDSGKTLDRWQLPAPLEANYPMHLDEENGLILLGVRKPAAASCVLALVSSELVSWIGYASRS